MFESKKNVPDSNGGWLVEMRSDEDTILNQQYTHTQCIMDDKISKNTRKKPSRLHKLEKETHKNTTTTF